MNEYDSNNNRLTWLACKGIHFAMELLLMVAAVTANPTCADLKYEYSLNLFGIDNRIPSLNRIIDYPDRGKIQTAYQVIPGKVEKLVWENKH